MVERTSVFVSNRLICPVSRRFFISESTACCKCSGTRVPYRKMTSAPSLNSILMLWPMILPCPLKTLEIVLWIDSSSGDSSFLFTILFTIFEYSVSSLASVNLKLKIVKQSRPMNDLFHSLVITTPTPFNFWLLNSTSTVKPTKFNGLPLKSKYSLVFGTSLEIIKLVFGSRLRSFLQRSF